MQPAAAILSATPGKHVAANSVAVATPPAPLILITRAAAPKAKPAIPKPPPLASITPLPTAQILSSPSSSVVPTVSHFVVPTRCSAMAVSALRHHLLYHSPLRLGLPRPQYQAQPPSSRRNISVESSGLVDINDLRLLFSSHDFQRHFHDYAIVRITLKPGIIDLAVLVHAAFFV
ncbi:MAG: hypothetical protein Q9220_001065 [cf. Caloplaca sp. 1 TL-2023]